MARASVCSVPVLGAVCGVVAGSANGVSFVWDRATGVVRNVVTKKVLALVTKAGCTAAAGVVTDGVGAAVAAPVCSKITDWLANHVIGGKAPSSGGGGGGGGGGGNGASSGASSGASGDGTPASVLSTGPMAALAAVATLFIAKHISADTQVNLTGGWFQSLYGAITSWAWLLTVVVIVLGATHVMLSSLTGSGGWGALGLVVGRIPFAAILMIGVPMAAMGGMRLADALSANVMVVFPDGTHLLHVLVAILGVLGAASALAGALGHSTIAHFTGTGAWLIASWGLVVSGAIALELLAREVAIYLTVLIVPLALVGEIFPPLARWATGLFKALFALIVSKVLLAVGLAVAGTAIGAGLTSFSPITVVVGLVALALVALFPSLIYGALIRTEHAWHTGGSQNVMSTPHHAMVKQIRGATSTAHQRTIIIQRPPSANGTPPPPMRETADA